MEIPKEKILELIRQRGDEGQAAQADQELPDQVDRLVARGDLDGGRLGHQRGRHLPDLVRERG